MLIPGYLKFILFRPENHRYCARCPMQSPKLLRIRSLLCTHRLVWWSTQIAKESQWLIFQVRRELEPPSYVARYFNTNRFNDSYLQVLSKAHMRTRASDWIFCGILKGRRCDLQFQFLLLQRYHVYASY